MIETKASVGGLSSRVKGLEAENKKLREVIEEMKKFQEQAIEDVRSRLTDIES